MEFDLENPLTSISTFKDSDTTATPILLFSSESDHMPSSDFLLCLKTSASYASFRREAIEIISQAADDSDPFLTYLAVNYMDRFTSRLENLENKPWVVRLVAISCLSLASKMRNSDFSASDFQREGCLQFDEKTINRMELTILQALQWRMRSITPFSFLPFFVVSFETTASEPALKQRALKSRAQDIIFKANNEIKLLEFRPSVVAAAALLAACQELFPLQFHSFQLSISSCDCVNTDDLVRCLDIVQKVMVYGSMVDSTMSGTRRTPLSVLNWDFVSGGKSESESNSVSGPTISSDDGVVGGGGGLIKRRKTNVYHLR